MTETNTEVRTTLRIPGVWSNPGELLTRLPEGFRLTPDALFLPDGTEIEFNPLAADKQFAGIFESSCRRPATAEEMALVRRYKVNIGLNGPGGSLGAALKMMQAGAAIVQAGGAGVFIDNCALAHGGGLWADMADDGGPDALSFAFVGIVRGRQDVYTIGMHVLGFPEISMRVADLDPNGESLVEVIRYICASDKPVGDGHLLGDELGPRFRAVATIGPGDERLAGGPMYNPFGCLKLTSMKDIAEGN